MLPPLGSLLRSLCARFPCLQTEASLQYHRFVARQPFANRSTITPELQQRVLGLAGPQLGARLPEVATGGRREALPCPGCTGPARACRTDAFQLGPQP
jgi:hypothetical protein